MTTPPDESTSPSRRRGRRAAWGLGVASVALLIGAGLFWRNAIKEEWLIWQLDSKDEEKRLAAAEKLAEMKSLRSVPYLVQLIEADERDGVQGWSSVIGIAGPMGGASGPLRTESGVRFTPVVFSLYRVGPGALPIVARILGEDQPRSPEEWESVWARVSPRVWMILCDVESAWENPQEKVERVERLSFPPGASQPGPVRQGISGKQRP
jgi:hypothetical protein